jgi:GDP-L-fucose synthase
MRSKKIFIAGQEGMVGKAIYKLLKKKKFLIIECNRKNLDLCNQDQVKKWFKKNKPEIVINAAGKVGGILDNSIYKHEYIYKNTTIGFNLLKSSLDNNIKKFINLGSACIYPKKNKQPIKESFLLSSKLEDSNEGYAIAKIAVLKYCEYIKNYFKKDFISLQPANLYGDGDNFNLRSSHVIPALVKKFHEAKTNKKKKVEIWGSGQAKREFLHVDDLANAVLFCIKNRISQNYVNIGGTDYLNIKNLSKIIKNITKYEGKIFYNRKYPDGVKERKLDTSIMNKLGWKPKIKLEEGLKEYYFNFKKIS